MRASSISLDQPGSRGHVSLRYQAKILKHVLSITPGLPGLLEVSIHGPKACLKHPESFAFLSDAQAAAHAFAHSVLNIPCACQQVFWTALRERRAARR